MSIIPDVQWQLLLAILLNIVDFGQCVSGKLHRHTNWLKLQPKQNLAFLCFIIFSFLGATEADLLEEISEKYDGKVVVSKELMIIE